MEGQEEANKRNIEESQSTDGEKEKESTLPPKKRGKFEIHSRQLFLTYPQCDLEKVNIEGLMASFLLKIIFNGGTLDKLIV